ncbi:hypothetical protein DOTSEDRAFT_77779 [Dothistroma septosporum NZE10]|uniref:GDP/GTP exchange factor Sec2 N-terminal domain-containing protein n=1 Tax=Dothistroma septosporum (strain NZE10 / CBS 128990) TaxID=675120 RepID=N1PWX0_DOTSN|nr:hypothetical protein DOTSEDRAFT_77779 [Dothistroma septosporum NZE10]
MAYHTPIGVRATTQRHGAKDSRISLDVGSGKDDVFRMRLKELEDENSILAEKTTAASQRFADYENNILQLRTQLREQQERHTAALAAHHAYAHAHAHAHEPEPSTPVQTASPGLSRLGSFMRKPSLAAVSSGPSPREQELEAVLAKEQYARIEAENKVKQVNAEVEELSATLFQQANDMVATERKANAALQAKIRELESVGADHPLLAASKENEKLRQKLQAMEQRDVDRRKRLDRLEAAQKRIDRVRTMLKPR